MKQVLTILAFSLFFLKNIAAHNGTIRGLVADAESNAEVAGAVVRLEPGSLSTASNELGVFAFADLAAGDYVLTVTFIGFETAIQTVRVADHETASVKFMLKPTALDLASVEVSAGAARPLSTLSALDFEMKPIQSSQDVLRFVPGVVIAQHAGGGKAEQIFLRGFDIDHGTDVALSVDGLPVNMVSHAHGQGYADLHWVIPEMIGGVDFQKGCYDASVGDFATAGAVRFRTKDALDRSFVKLEAGQFETARAVAAVDLLGDRARQRGQSAYLAGEHLFSNSYFDDPQGFRRSNLMGKYRADFDEKKYLTLSFSTFSSEWNASGQIPDRLVESGQLSRFGSVDNSEGGSTGRTNLSAELLTAVNDHSFFKNQFYVSRYRFELFSNFTFFLENPVAGDEIRQKENRDIYGYRGSWQSQTRLFGKNLALSTGLDLRLDQTENSELSFVTKRTTLNRRLKLGNIDEANAALFGSANWDFAKNWSLTAGLRLDEFRFSYEDLLDSTAGRPASESKGIASPKLSLRYAISKNLELYCSAGTGFHSNDARSVVPTDGRDGLPRATGLDLGFFAKPLPKLVVGGAFWQMGLAQEFVYVGDAAVVEAGGKTQRLGADLSVRWQLSPTLFFDADYAYSHGRAIDAPKGEDRIPLAPTHVGQGGLDFRGKSGFGASLDARWVGDRPANEDNSLIAEGYFVVDGSIRFSQKRWEIGLTAQNLLNTKWKEAQFETETRLQNEASPVTEICFTPGTPFFLKAGATVFF